MTRRIATALLFATIATGVSAAGAGPIVVDRTKIDITGTGYVKTYPCNGRDVIITGSKHVVTLTGTCKSLDVTGTDNRVTITLVPDAEMTITGSRHVIRWRSTKEPMMDVTGVDNSIERMR